MAIKHPLRLGCLPALQGEGVLTWFRVTRSGSSLDTAGENRERGNGPVRILMKSGMWLVPESERPLD